MTDMDHLLSPRMNQTDLHPLEKWFFFMTPPFRRRLQLTRSAKLRRKRYCFRKRRTYDVSILLQPISYSQHSILDTGSSFQSLCFEMRVMARSMYKMKCLIDSERLMKMKHGLLYRLSKLAPLLLTVTHGR